VLLRLPGRTSTESVQLLDRDCEPLVFAMRRAATPDDRRAPPAMARRLRAGMDNLSDRTLRLHRGRQDLDLVLARPKLRFHIYDLLAPSPTIDNVLLESTATPLAHHFGDLLWIHYDER
jgi:hypothetical protein